MSPMWQPSSNTVKKNDQRTLLFVRISVKVSFYLFFSLYLLLFPHNNFDGFSDDDQRMIALAAL